MKLDSKFFDRLRVKPKDDRVLHAKARPNCDWKGCNQPGIYPAPKGRGREGQYFNFCLDHVRHYNKSYNYFEGLSDEAMQQHLKNDVIGHRPTWSMGGRNGTGADAKPEGASRFAYAFGVQDPFSLFEEDVADTTISPTVNRPLMKVERKCLKALDLEDSATKPEIRARFKQLVMRHHPDHNGGDRSTEDKLREVLQAYNYLREVGLA
ncbi:DnaJ domain-containing protein [Methyloligella sp. 2.7D]|uniref:J domain-containing protein n=1 Tax=unclassified Methyloligella TaxID=2625955 RepID=UPI00157E2694|nr:DnaJ domain-containing protein [Methyloligella sp. GL2]QKP76577.1 DnaJ domain-containing protein [Methyloligella sp. GL2]